MAFRMTGYSYPGSSPNKKSEEKQYKTDIFGTAEDKEISAMGEYRQGNLPYHLMNRRDRRMERKRRRALTKRGVKGYDVKELKGPNIFQRIRNIGRAGFGWKAKREQRRKDKKYGSASGHGDLL